MEDPERACFPLLLGRDSLCYAHGDEVIIAVANLLQDTLDADYTLRSYSRDEMPQYQGRAHQIQLAEGMTYRFVFLARHNLSNIDLQITDSEGKLLAQDDPLDQNGSVMLDFTPESSGTYYMSTEVGDLGGPSVRTETLLYTFMKPTSSAP